MCGGSAEEKGKNVDLIFFFVEEEGCMNRRSKSFEGEKDVKRRERTRGATNVVLMM